MTAARDLGPAVGWIDESGRLFPLCYYKPEHANYLDAHKANWRPVYAPAVAPVAAPITLSTADLALADEFSKVRSVLPLARSS